MPYDLVVKGGHVLDPGQGLDGVMDIGITDGKIAAIQTDIPAKEAKPRGKPCNFPGCASG